jgi:GAF domain-containing protein
MGPHVSDGLGGTEQDIGRQLQDFALRFSDEWAGRAVEPDEIVEFAAKAVPHTIAAGLTLVRGDKRPTTLAATTELARQVDELEYDTREGPCLDAIRNDDIVAVADLERDPRWPSFSEQAIHKTPIRSMFGVRVFLGGDDRGALNFYAPQAGAFTELDLGIGAVLSTMASLALQNAIAQRKTVNLEIALESSRQIGTAIGILMSSRLITADRAFDQLRQVSQNTHRKIRDVALDVMETGTLPEVASAPRRGA